MSLLLTNNVPAYLRTTLTAHFSVASDNVPYGPPEDCEVTPGGGITCTPSGTVSIPGETSQVFDVVGVTTGERSIVTDAGDVDTLVWSITETVERDTNNLVVTWDYDDDGAGAATFKLVNVNTGQLITLTTSPQTIDLTGKDQGTWKFRVIFDTETYTLDDSSYDFALQAELDGVDFTPDPAVQGYTVDVTFDDQSDTFAHDIYLHNLTTDQLIIVSGASPVTVSLSGAHAGSFGLRVVFPDFADYPIDLNDDTFQVIEQGDIMSVAATPIAQGQATELGYVVETTKGTTPDTPTMKLLRCIDRTINVKKNTIASEEIQRHRNITHLRHGMRRVDGSILCELATVSYDDIWEAIFRGTWAAVTTSGTPNLAVAASAKTITRATGSFLTDNYRPGDIIVTTGFTNSGNNGTFTILSLTATVITLVASTTGLVDETTASGRTLTLKGKRLDIGTTMRTLTIERRYTDLTQYEPFVGCAVPVGAVSIQPEKMIQLALTILGMSGSAMTGSSLGTPSTTGMSTEPMTAFEGAIFEGGTSFGMVTGLDFNINNGDSLGGVVGSPISPDVFQAMAPVTGVLKAYLTDAVLYNKFINETQSKLWMKMSDPSGEFLHIVMPAIKYTGNDKTPPKTGGVVQEAPFQALYDTVTGTSISIQRSNT